MLDVRLRFRVLALAATALAAACGSTPASSGGSADLDAQQASDVPALGDAGSDASGSDAQILDPSGGTDAAATSDDVAGGDWPWMQPCPVEAPSSSAVATTSAGLVKGEPLGSGWVFRGIPFAAPPVGALRWAAPQPPACWSGERDASQFGPVCPQKDAKTGAYEGSEDCLTLNVWRPAPNSELFPVLVFIHGGGNIQGSASESLLGGSPTYGGQHFSSENTVVVTVQYRLGALGWLSLPALDSEQGGHSGNYGLLDQQAALRWVKQNIVQFGGDPSRVLVFGESAGAVNTCSLLASPASKDLFHAALMESGNCSQPSKSTYQTGMASKLTSSDCAEASSPLDCLRALSAQQVVQQLPGSIGVASTALLSGQGGYGPHVDGVTLPKAPIDALADGSALQVPFVVGANEEELAQMLTDKVTTQEELDALIAKQFALFGSSVVEQVQELYVASQFASPQAALIQLYSDLRFVCPTRHIARSALAGRSKANSDAGVWRYHFARQPPTKQGNLPAAHGLELLYVFGSLLDIPLYNPPAADVALSASMRAAWRALAAHGDPNPVLPNAPATPSWLAYANGSDNALWLDATIEMKNGIHAARCDAWETILAGL